MQPKLEDYSKIKYCSKTNEEKSIVSKKGDKKGLTTEKKKTYCRDVD